MLPIPRRLAREKALQALYQIDLTGATPEKALEALFPDAKIPDEVDDFVVSLVYGTQQHQENLDQCIRPYLRGWTLERLSVIDRNILRMALFEMMHIGTPFSVVMDEAVELAKRFSTDEGRRFVNGVLSAVSRDMEKDSASPGDGGV